MENGVEIFKNIFYILFYISPVNLNETGKVVPEKSWLPQLIKMDF